MRYLILAALLTASSAHAQNYVVAQKDKAFVPAHLRIKVGDTVDFVNGDPFFHNVFSLSDAKTFDLGSYPEGQGRKVTFDTPGVVTVECAIHPHMKMTIEVTK